MKQRLNAIWSSSPHGPWGSPRPSSSETTSDFVPPTRARDREAPGGGDTQAGRGPGLARRLPPQGCPLPAASRSPGAPRPVRPARLGASEDRAAVRLPLPHRDLHAGGEAAVRLLRAPVPLGGAARRPRRCEGRPGGSSLLVHAVHFEPDVPPEAMEELASELALLARWLELERVVGLQHEWRCRRERGYVGRLKHPKILYAR